MMTRKSAEVVDRLDLSKQAERTCICVPLECLPESCLGKDELNNQVGEVTGSVESAHFFPQGLCPWSVSPWMRATEAPGLEVTLGLGKRIQCNKGMGPEHS